MKVLSILLATLGHGKNLDDCYRLVSTCNFLGGIEGEIKLIEYHCGKDFRQVTVSGKLDCIGDGCANGWHGFHVHTSPPYTDDYGNVNCTMCGPHFAGADQTHGTPWNAHSHYGDLGNVYFYNNQTTIYQKSTRLSLNNQDENYIGGRSLVVHAQVDDYQGASGNAGARIGCCGITEAEKKITRRNKLRFTPTL